MTELNPLIAVSIPIMLLFQKIAKKKILSAGKHIANTQGVWDSPKSQEDEFPMNTKWMIKAPWQWIINQWINKLVYLKMVRLIYT